MNAIIRPAVPEDAHAIAFIHVTTWQTTYPHILPPEFLSALSVERREEMWRGFFESEHQNSYLYVAEVDGQVIAFANFGPMRDDYPDYDCEMYAIYIMDTYHGKGYGRALLRAAIELMAKDGFKAMYAWVLDKNPATLFYEAVGGVRFDQREMEIAGVKVMEYAYGYTDLASRVAQV